MFEAKCFKKYSVKKAKSTNPRCGVSLLEVMVALSLLSVVLLSVMAVRMMVRGNEEMNRSQLTGLALLRQAGMDFTAGRIFTNATTEGKSETGHPYHLTRQLETNISLGYLRMNLDLNIDGDNQNESFAVYASRLLLIPVGDTNTSWWSRPLVSEPVLDPLIGMYEVKVLSSDQAKGTVYGEGNYSYNSLVKIKAESKPGYQFIQWQGLNVDSPNSKQTSIYVRDDLEITALFQ